MDIYEVIIFCVHVVEKQPFMEPSTYLLTCFCGPCGCIYVFNISDSKGAYSPCIMIQWYIFGISDEQPIPKNVREAVTTMKNILNDWTSWFFICVVVFISLVFFLQTLLYCLTLPYSSFCILWICISYGYAIPYKSVNLYTTVGEHVHHTITPLGVVFKWYSVHLIGVHVRHTP